MRAIDKFGKSKSEISICPSLKKDKRGLESGTLIKIAIAVVVLAVIAIGIVLIINLTKPDVCNNDGVCDSEAGETVENCASDCEEIVESNAIPIPEEYTPDEDYFTGNLPGLEE